MQGLLAGLLVLSVTYFGGKGLLQRFFFRTGYVYAEETERAEELQEYVTQNKLSVSDYKMLKKWGTERNIDDFTISRGKWLLFDISYNGKIMYGSREIPNLTWTTLFTSAAPIAIKISSFISLPPFLSQPGSMPYWRMPYSRSLLPGLPVFRFSLTSGV